LLRPGALSWHLRLKELFKYEGSFVQIGCSCWLVNPAAKTMGKAAGNRDEDRAGFPGVLVDLRCDIKVGKGIINFDQAVEEGEVISGQYVTENFKKGADDLVGFINGDFGGVFIELFVGFSITEVVFKHPANVFLVLNDAWAKVFV
jgi:hypothetical protein